MPTKTKWIQLLPLVGLMCFQLAASDATASEDFESSTTWVISDVHMSDGQAPYALFRDTTGETPIPGLNYPELLKEFLIVFKNVTIPNHNLLILGDFFDLWMYPTQELGGTPYNFDDIIGNTPGRVNPDNKAIMDLIYEILSDPKGKKIYFASGNHDMAPDDNAAPDDQHVSQEQIERICDDPVTRNNCMIWVPSSEYFTKEILKLEDSTLWVEHGNSVDMTNARNPDGLDTLESLPLGYYMTRMAVTSPDQLTTGQYIRNHLPNCLYPEKSEGVNVPCVVNVLMEGVNDAGAEPQLDANKDILFRPTNPVPSVKIWRIMDSYTNLNEIWNWDPFNLVEFRQSLMVPFDENREGLHWYAEEVNLRGYTNPATDFHTPQTLHIVMGHTHKGGQRILNDGQYNRTYTNTGCWCHQPYQPDPFVSYAEINATSPVSVKVRICKRHGLEHYWDCDGLGQEQGRVLFVADGYYDQEDDLYTYFHVTRGFDVEVKGSEDIDESIVLSDYDMIVLTGFAPWVSWGGIQNIESSGVPVLIVEYWDFWYSYMFDMIYDDWAYFGDNTLAVTTGSSHEITHELDSPLQAYNPEYYVLGVSEWSIKPGVTELLYGPSWDQISVIVDDSDSRKIVATGLHEIDIYTDAAWDVMDRCVDYLMSGTN